MTAPKRILIVDDDERTRQVLRAMVENMGHQVEEARDGFDALAQLRLGVDLVLLDIVMPGIDGFEVVRQIRENPETKEIPVVMVTALSEREDRIRAIQMGANDFISKPVDMLELQLRTSFLIQMKETQDEIKRNRRELEAQLDQRTGVLRKALQDMASAQRKAHSAHLETIQRLAIAAEYKDKDTAAHIKRLGHYCAAIARHVGFSPNEIETIFHASPMHDVGKLGIPDKQLLKADKLDQDEWKIMKKHPVIGARILEGSGSELLQAGEEIALSHHERWDGDGYPFGRAGDEIPIMGRVCTVADVFDALTNKRPYKKAFSNHDTFALMREGRGTHFDPKVLDAFFDHLPEMEDIQSQFREEAAFSEMGE